MNSFARILVAILSLSGLVILQSCNLFETRTPEAPNQSGFQYLPQTFPANVVSNLQNAIGQKDVVGYMACITDSAHSHASFSFTPSADAAEVYGSLLRNWNLQLEQSYFTNLVSKRKLPQGFSSLSLHATDSIPGTETFSYSFDYTFFFEHTESGFPQSATGSLQFTLVNDNSQWTISRWVDLKTSTHSSDLTWSSFKGKFSN